ncbi:twin-arginine translocase TatA/TatE family subunit [Leucobacter chromiireducens]|uniref:Sec-independent protein translocase protein TatA n=1 Tax=Leucobacter chromiireducens subsp. chromiireducens TaxID=660067 RepID=A0ABS1SMR1_9MICO|nr:twin-arginine translocase TatA/TatE family subunit [Leucobacter chromiireducens]MBL3688789.1 twin-arginine translocase TatA/TatE family subunit [Leucobacter chromiireducens subsp. chromiireducens]
MIGNMGGPTLIIILFIILLLFGAPKLPGLAKSLGQSMRILKKEVRNDGAEEGGKPATDSDAPAADVPAADVPAADAKPTGDTTPGEEPKPGS